MKEMHLNFRSLNPESKPDSPETRKKRIEIEIKDVSGLLPKEVEYLKKYERLMFKETGLRSILNSNQSEEQKREQLKDYFEEALTTAKFKERKNNPNRMSEYSFSKKNIDTFIQNLIDISENRVLHVHCGKPRRAVQTVLLKGPNDLKEGEKEIISEAGKKGEISSNEDILKVLKKSAKNSIETNYIFVN